jgi:hypothetical protein
MCFDPVTRLATAGTSTLDSRALLSLAELTPAGPGSPSDSNHAVPHYVLLTPGESFLGGTPGDSARHGRDFDSQWPDPLSPSSEQFPSKDLAVHLTPVLLYDGAFRPFALFLLLNCGGPRPISRAHSHPICRPTCRRLPIQVTNHPDPTLCGFYIDSPFCWVCCRSCLGFLPGIRGAIAYAVTDHKNTFSIPRLSLLSPDPVSPHLSLSKHCSRRSCMAI